MARLSDGFTRVQSDQRYQPQVPALVVPALVDVPLVSSLVAFTAVNQLRTVRAIIPRSGQLRDVSWFVGTASGNCIGCVFDTGDALTGSRTKLADSGSVAVAGTNAWQSWDPNLAVTAGQQVELGLILDNTSATIGRGAAGAHNNTSTMPTGFAAAPGGALPKLATAQTLGGFAAATIAEASLFTSTPPVLLIARIS